MNLSQPSKYLYQRQLQTRKKQLLPVSSFIPIDSYAARDRNRAVNIRALKITLLPLSFQKPRTDATAGKILPSLVAAPNREFLHGGGPCRNDASSRSALSCERMQEDWQEWSKKRWKYVVRESPYTYNNPSLVKSILDVEQSSLDLSQTLAGTKICALVSGHAREGGAVKL